MSGLKPLTGTCDGCGRPDGINIPTSFEHFCPVCAANGDNYRLAAEHFLGLIAPVIEVWRTHWIARGVEPGILLESLENHEDEIIALMHELNEANPKHEAADFPNVLQQAA